MIQETFKLWDLVRLILEVLLYMHFYNQSASAGPPLHSNHPRYCRRWRLWEEPTFETGPVT